jgi:hypothetical protein
MIEIIAELTVRVRLTYDESEHTPESAREYVEGCTGRAILSRGEVVGACLEEVEGGDE